MVDFNPIDVPDLQPEPLRQAAGGFRTTAMQIVQSGEEIPAATGRAAQDFSGSFNGRIRTQGEQSRTAIQTTAFMNIYGAGITDHWAQNVADFKRRRQELIDQFEQAQSRNFGVRSADFPPQDWEGFTTARERAGQKLVAILNGQAQANYQQLMAHADQRGEELKQPPNARTLRGLLGGGYLFPGLPPAELKTLMTQLKNTVPAGPVVRLPGGFGLFGGMPVFNKEQGDDDEGPTTGAGDDDEDGPIATGDEDGPDLPYTIEWGPNGPIVHWRPVVPSDPPVPPPGSEPGGDAPPPWDKPLEGPPQSGRTEQGAEERRNPPDGVPSQPQPTGGWGVLWAILRILLKPNPND